ncbi:hypothetical protein HPB50_010753 [Hyalomma asiaticum]|uniref:Uncharacterized protein n=1 Tax=Hyalomma asiaticum TaxID=266040 RepID=A0ACB7T968_HYAAI|nr:hypothetical protein HPB50_010753 [Hyalomma asiaticum]
MDPPPPPASQALEPRCAWNGDNFRTRPQGNGSLAFSDERSSSGWELSDRALDPYTYARRAACAADGREGPPGRSSAATAASKKKQSSSRVLRKARLLRATTRYEQGCGDSGDHRRGTRREKAKQQRSFRSGVAAAALENSGNSATLRSRRPLSTIVIPLPGGAELSRPLFDRRPCLHTFMARQPLGPVHIARASCALCPASMPDNGASRKMKRRWSAPQHSNTGPSHARRTGGRSSNHLGSPASSSPGTQTRPVTAADAAPASSPSDILGSPASTSPGLPTWSAAPFNNSATTAAVRGDSSLLDMDFGAFLEG